MTSAGTRRGGEAVLYASKLESWADALDRLDAGEDVAWMEMSNGPSLFIRLTGEHDCPEVVVEDESGSMVTVRVPIVPPDDWIADHRERLRQVRDYWIAVTPAQGAEPPADGDPVRAPLRAGGGAARRRRGV
ncbi:DUF5959 family protein [Streptomyces sp. NPDC006544]|uniref:DUF5959 family protein n=1 Tax=Streptomyces sp. NPDC006544 TaxID=3154583 RepID=UPI0033A005B5